MKRIVCTLLLLLAIFGQTTAQSTAFVLKGGLSIGSQKWDNSIERELLWRYHAALAFETINNENDQASFYAQIGYHLRGSATRFRTFDINNPSILGAQYTEALEFRNAALQLGLKIRLPDNGGSARFYYFGGLRTDYNINNNINELRELNLCNVGALPFEEGVQKWTLGMSLGAGTEFAFGDLVGGQFEFSLNPDFTPQYLQGAIPNVIDQCQPGNSFTIPERRIRNFTIELSVGLRLLRKVIYE